jgi:hypothetical protein
VCGNKQWSVTRDVTHIRFNVALTNEIHIMKRDEPLVVVESFLNLTHVTVVSSDNTLSRQCEVKLRAKSVR